MKKLILLTIVSVLLAAGLISASPFLARFTVLNQTEEPIYISMDYPYTWLTVPAGEKVQFTIERDEYDAKVYACGLEVEGTIDLTRNLRLNFTPCYSMLQTDLPKYIGEPSMEKVNFYRAPGTADWQFKFRSK